MKNKLPMSGPYRFFSGIRDKTKRGRAIGRKLLARYDILTNEPPWKPEDSVTLVAIDARFREIDDAYFGWKI